MYILYIWYVCTDTLWSHTRLNFSISKRTNYASNCCFTSANSSCFFFLFPLSLLLRFVSLNNKYQFLLKLSIKTYSQILCNCVYLFWCNFLLRSLSRFLWVCTLVTQCVVIWLLLIVVNGDTSSACVNYVNKFQLTFFVLFSSVLCSLSLSFASALSFSNSLPVKCKDQFSRFFFFFVSSFLRLCVGFFLFVCLPQYLPLK